MDTLAAMRTFVAIVDSGSLTAAAETMDRSQPAVVRSLAALEAHLGTRLLQRTTRRMSLTPEGSDYLERCRQILWDVDEAERAVSQDETELKGLVRITAPVQFGQLHVAPLLSRFLADHPLITADLLLVDRNVDLVDEGIDLALRIGALPDSGLIALPVGEVKRVVCASASLLERVSMPAAPQELASLPCVRVENLARSGTWVFRDGFADVGVKVSGPLSCNQIAAAISACVDGTGFGQFLSYQVQDQLRIGTLKRVLQKFEVPALPVNVIYPGGRFATARQRALARFLRTELRERVFRADH
jgi:DNA-binding transcriptional LysR family regulator